MYTATILNKAIENGVLSVMVSFKDDHGVEFPEQFTTSQKQSTGWIEEQVKRKLTHLNAIPSLHDSIQVGQIISSDTDTDSSLAGDPARQEYKKDLVRFEKFVSALAKGFTTRENDDFVALKKKLTANFTPAYLDLF